MNNSLVLLISTVVFALVYANPGKEIDHMDGGAMNMTDMDPSNMTGGPMNGHSAEKSSEEKKSPRSSRGVGEDLKNAGKDAMNTMENAGKNAWDKAGELGKSGINTVQSAGSAVKNGAKDLAGKVDKAL
ncbi:Dauer Up-Regulated [Caenorhabditis elegans]|uniref:Dauer Up-Regulated n=1 Tax=Caenorhabditis elegans TaxID=6239 RepID=O01595_CAEEL|nr:Dauer Up-Regulated [Caenorhabditis elegans]CCD73281.1 Dauer Up-Regulated [Caenorhabditis elegans]|eukprot:NP_504043.2 Uncharacterized protein CELE_R08E5.4 [Caenorhabditis elegans]